MKSGQTEEVRIPAVLGSEKIVRERTGAFAVKAGFGAERIEDIKTAVGEAALNAIEHGLSRDPSGMVIIRLESDREGIRITVSNKGRPFVPPDAKPDIKDKIEGKDRPRGWGLFLIKQLADDVSVKHEDGVTTIAMKFCL
jgi:serine/threonine-protein kinase RsbW